MFRPLLGFVVELGMGFSAPPRFDAKMTPMVAQEVAVAPRRSHDAQNIDAVARKKVSADPYASVAVLGLHLGHGAAPPLHS
jgi:hypothetical protein